MNDNRLKFRTPYYLGDKFAGFQYWEFEHGRVKLIGDYWEPWVSKRDELTAKPDEQCTGLSDKIGNLIYEGDIIRFVRQRGSYQTQKDKTAIVEFGTYRFCGFGYRENPEWPVMCALTETATKKCVITGNIHEREIK